MCKPEQFQRKYIRQNKFLQRDGFIKPKILSNIQNGSEYYITSMSTQLSKTTLLHIQLIRAKNLSLERKRLTVDRHATTATTYFFFFSRWNTHLSWTFIYPWLKYDFLRLSQRKFLNYEIVRSKVSCLQFLVKFQEYIFRWVLFFQLQNPKITNFNIYYAYFYKYMIYCLAKAS